jgi:prepilin-type N-terminal cleavage/methylation domain-containing protein
MKVGTPRASGISLIELLVVMALLGLAATLVAPSIGGGLDNLILRSTGRQLVSVLRQVQAEARTRQTTLAARVEDGRIVLVEDGGVRIVDLNSSIRIGGGTEASYVVLGSGQIIGPERLVLENGRGRRGALLLGPLPGQIHFVEEGG